MSLFFKICHMSHLLVEPPPLSESHRSSVLDHQASHQQTFFTTMSFNSVIDLCDSARAAWRLESAKLDITWATHEGVVGVCVSRCKMSEGLQGDMFMDEKYDP